MSFDSRGRTFARWILLICVLAAPLQAGFQIRDSRLFLGDAPFFVQGVVYSNVPIGRRWTATFAASSCLYPRDFPLIQALGANTIRTLAMVPAGDRAFAATLQTSGLYWLAGFPLDRFHDPSVSLSPATAGGRELRARILAEFIAYVRAWKREPRLMAFVFGDDLPRDYNSKFAGSPADFFSLLGEVSVALRELGGEPVLLTTTVSDPEHAGSLELGSHDAAQAGLDFWSVHDLGAGRAEQLVNQLSARTSKPILISAFGIDAYDDALGQPNPAAQAAAARLAGSQIIEQLTLPASRLMGGIFASYMDEWWRSGDPDEHTTESRAHSRFPDGRLHESWTGLFEVTRTLTPGLDRLRPRDAYFALAELWAGAAPPEFSESRAPQLAPAGPVNMAGGLTLLSPGGLFQLRGQDLASYGRSVGAGHLPFHLGPISVCVAGEPAPVLFSDRHEIRGQLPWGAQAGRSEVRMYRAGVLSTAASAATATLAPGIFPDGVFRPGRPCPVNEDNGVAPGEYLEIYGSGLGPGETTLADGEAPAGLNVVRQAPVVRLGSETLPVLFSGMLAGMVGVYQTNVQIPENFAPSSRDLTMLQLGAVSNLHRIRVTSETEKPAFRITFSQPGPVVLQAGGPPRTVFVLLNGQNAFCDLVRFELSGIPPGVTASIPVGVPGQTLPLTFQAEAGVPPGEFPQVSLTGRSVIPETVTETIGLTVLPSQGGIEFRVVSGGFVSTVPVASFEMAGNLLYKVHGGGPGRGFNFMTIDPVNGVLGPALSFDTWGSEQAVAAMEDYLKSLPAGVVVLGAIADDGFLLLTDEARRVLRATLGTQLIEYLDYQYSWAIITRKGAVRPIAERFSPNGLVVLTETLTFPMTP